MDIFATKPASDRKAVFSETAARRGISALVIEKDFWVCWCLKRVFEMADVPGHIFKGGTSLSKVYGVINRFSEDVDISIDRAGLGFSGPKDPAAEGLSGKTREKLRDGLAHTCSEFVGTEILPRFKKSCEKLLGSDGWDASMDARDPDHQSILFKYPRSLAEYVAGAYLTPTVLLEFGCRGDQWPATDHTVEAFAAEEFPKMFSDPHVPVRVLAAERTFWEKVTLIHAENHRRAGSAPRPRTSRHYSDIAQMFNSEIGRKALGDMKLLEQVVAHKRVFFPSGWAHYDDAKPGTLSLVPNLELEKLLRSDYQQMAEMFFGDPLPFDTILDGIRKLEAAVNQVQNPPEETPDVPAEDV